jgi:hypothetical protein
MVWFRVDDGFIEHPKLRELEREPERWARAVALWLAAGTYSARNLTDGYVTRDRARRVTPMSPEASLAAAEDLVKIGLWETVGDDFQFHDWAEYQLVRSELEAQRKDAAERQRRTRRKRLGLPPLEPVTVSVTRDVSCESQTPVPARPDPIIQEEEPLASARAALVEFYPDLAKKRPQFVDELIADHAGVDVARCIREAHRWESDHPKKAWKNKTAGLRRWVARPPPPWKQNPHSTEGRSVTGPTLSSETHPPWVERYIPLAERNGAGQ